MDNPQPRSDKSFPSVEWAALLPGPNRKQSQHVYVYRLIYLNLNQGKPGCVMTWEVEGGRLAYQIAVEREESGRLRCHCTCADAVFRAQTEGRVCKHVQGFLIWSGMAPDLSQSGPTEVRLGA